MAFDPTKTATKIKDLIRIIFRNIRDFFGGITDSIKEADVLDLVENNPRILDFTDMDQHLSRVFASSEIFVASVFSSLITPNFTNTAQIHAHMVRRMSALTIKNTTILVNDVRNAIQDFIFGSASLRDTAQRLRKIKKRTRANFARFIRTETVRAHNIAVINRTIEIADFNDKRPRVRWITKDDGRVRPTHVRRHNVIYTVKKAQSMLGEPNCRCGLSPVIV